MTITKDQLREIEALREWGDTPELARITKTPKSTMYWIMKTGNCSTRVAGQILKFYKIRKQEREAIKKMLEDND